MRCGFCDREIPEQVEQQACGACPGGCKWIHCPNCGYKNPAPSKLFKRFLRKSEKKTED